VASHFGIAGRANVDLAGANRRLLIEAGLSPNRVYVSNLCTICLPEEFYSFRREKEAAGRQYSFAGILRR
jgi:copper oxidase (laccase) domain-containing protein